MDLLGQVDRKETGYPLEGDQIQTEHHVIKVLAQSRQSLSHEVL